MAGDDMWDYYFSVLTNLYGEVSVSHARDLNALLGNNYFNLPTTLTEQDKALLRQLAGPHGKTILKAYRIQKGLKP